MVQNLAYHRTYNPIHDMHYASMLNTTLGWKHICRENPASYSVGNSHFCRDALLGIARNKSVELIWIHK